MKRLLFIYLFLVSHPAHGFGSEPFFAGGLEIPSGTSLPGVDGSVRAFAKDSAGNLYLGGSFNSVGNITANNIAVRRSNGTWSALGTGLNNVVYALTVDASGNLYVGGHFSIVDNVMRRFVTIWLTMKSAWL